DQAFERVRQQSEAAGNMPGGVFQRENEHTDQYAPSRQAYGSIHPFAYASGVNLIRALFERGGEAPERLIEHRAHEQAERTAAELIVDEELDLAFVLVNWQKTPAIVHAPEWA